MKIGFGMVAASMALLAAGCGGGSKPEAGSPTATTPPAIVTSSTPTPTPTPTVPAVDYGKQYLALIAPFNAAINKFDAYASSHSLTTDQAVAEAAPASAALTSFDDAALRATWPADARADIKLLVADDAKVEADFSNDEVDITTYFSTINADNAVAAAQSNIVRSDLGLPPPPTGSGTPTTSSTAT